MEYFIHLFLKVVPFIPTLIKQLGFSPVILGLIYTVLPIVSILTKPVFGIIADKFRRQKLLFLVFQVSYKIMQSSKFL